MIQFLKKTWNNYKKLEWWNKLFLFLPVVIIVVLCLCMFFIKPISNRSKYIKEVKYNKKQTDEKISLNQKEQAEIKEFEEEIKKKQEIIKKKIKGNHDRTKTITKDIDDAVSNNDADKLKRIISDLNKKSKTRGRGTNGS